MKIEVRNININQSLSEETYAYTATVYVDGVKAFAARNSGTGGADRYDKLPGYGGPSLEEIDRYLATTREPDTRYGMTLAHDLELEVNEQLSAHLRKREVARIERSFDKLLKSKIVGLKDGSIFTWKAPPTADNIAKLSKAKPEYTIVNGATGELRVQAFAAYCPELSENA